MKKFVSGILALAMVAVTAVSSVASAAGSFIPGKDPNGDGVLTLADSVYIRQVLGGKFIPSDLTQLDVDDNCVVSMADVVMAQRAEIGIYSASEMENADSPMNVAASSTSTSYRVYNAKTGAYKREYSLSVEDGNNTARTNYMAPIIDNQIIDYSNRGTAKVIRTNNSTYTGFVVGKHTIATAAHVVFNTVNNTSYNLADILLFDENGNPTSFTPVESHLPTDYYNQTSSNNFNNDYALITVKEDLTDYMSFGVGMLTDPAGNQHIDVSTVGFPYSHYNNPVEHHERVASGVINEVTIDLIWHSSYYTNGDDGGPLYVTETVAGQTYHSVVGINVDYTGYNNCSVRFTPDVLKFLVGNTNLQY